MTSALAGLSRTLAAQLPSAAPGSQVLVKGWVHRRRVLGGVTFLIVRDRSGLAQVVVRDPETRQAVRRYGEETVVAVAGVATRNPAAPGGAEVTEPRITLLGEPAQAPPVDLWRPALDAGLPAVLDHAAVTWRHPVRRARWELAAASLHGFRAALDELGFTEIQTPKFVPSATESGASVFRVDYFGRPAYLAQSPQFYKQMAIAAGIDRVFEIGPVFRAEPSFTSRHATEFTGVDVELAWISGVEDVMDFEERMLAHVLAAVAEAHGAAFRESFGVEVRVPRVPFPRLPLAQALQLSRTDPADSPRADLDPAGERATSAHIAGQTGHEFVFVTEYPASVRPFYHMRPPGEPDLTCSFDLLWRGLEITTGAQREHRYEVLVSQAAEKGLSLEPMRSYLDCFRYGCPPHGGFGLGLGRLLMVLLGLDSIREATFLFRGPNRLSP
jgi:aspartyl-tRNA synthetase